MASQAKVTLVHISLIFSAMLNVVLGVVAYLAYNDNTELLVLQADLTQKAANAEKADRTKLEQIQALKKLIGYDYADVGLDADPNQPADTVRVAMLHDIRDLGGDLKQTTYSATLKKLREELDAAIEQRNKLDADLAESKKRILSLSNQYDASVDVAEQARDEAKSELTAEVQKKDEQLAAKNQQAEILQKELNDLRLQAQNVEDQYRELVAELEEKLTFQRTQNERLVEKVDRITRTSFEVPDGLIQRVDHATGLVWINLGYADLLPRRTTFSVYDKGNAGVGRTQEGANVEDIKASIEVTDVIGPHLAVAKLIDVDISRPVSEKDYVYTPLWTPGKKLNFAFVGLIDLDGDGRSDRELLHDIVNAAGAKITTEVNDAGELTGEPIDIDTKFLVYGKIPLSTEVAGEEKDAALEMAKHHKEMTEEARLHGVRRMSLNDFLSFIGYKPTRRVWVPGEKTPWTLRSGAHSTSVDEALGNRESSGTTSAAYKKADRYGKSRSYGAVRKSFGRLPEPDDGRKYSGDAEKVEQ